MTIGELYGLVGLVAVTVALVGVVVTIIGIAIYWEVEIGEEYSNEP